MTDDSRPEGIPHLSLLIGTGLLVFAALVPLGSWQAPTWLQPAVDTWLFIRLPFVAITLWALLLWHVFHRWRLLDESQRRMVEAQCNLAEAQRIAHVGNWVWDFSSDNIYWSDESYRIFGFSPQQFPPNYEMFLQTVHPEERSGVKFAMKCALEQGVPHDIRYRIIRPDGAERVVHERGEIIFAEDHKPVRMIGTVQDVTEIERARAHIRRSLDEKEVLLREVHHRVKNNMQVITGLLQLQAQSIADEAARAAFRESCDRVKSMALVHDRLYHAGNMADVDFQDYLHTLVSELFATYRPAGSHIEVELDVERVVLPVDVAVPCGLLINELVTNCLKHAFPNASNGKVTVALHPVDDGMLELSVCDDGTGLPADMDWEHSTTLGLHLVQMLIKQIQGKIEFGGQAGTCVRVRFRGD